MQSAHSVDVLTTRNNFEEKVEFGCAACPSFRPPTVMLWDSHFAASFKSCQGSSSRVRSRVAQKSLSWCEACAETRADLERHLAGPAHRDRVRRMAEAGAGKLLLSCGDCDVVVASEANLWLHRRMAKHSTKEEVH